MDLVWIPSYCANKSELSARVACARVLEVLDPHILRAVDEKLKIALDLE